MVTAQKVAKSRRLFGLGCYKLVTNKNDFVKVLGIANKCSEFKETEILG